jgi:hypothetical protein
MSPEVDAITKLESLITRSIAEGLAALRDKLEDLQIANDAREEEHQDLLDRVRELEGRL